MKTLVLSLFVTIFLFSCDPNSNKQIGDANRRSVGADNGGGSGGGTGSGGTGTGGTPTDVPLDGGLSLLLVAGAAYGVKRARTQKAKGEAGR